MGRPRVSNASEGHHHQDRGSGGGGGSGGDSRGAPHHADSGSGGSVGSGGRQSSPPTTTGVTEARWLSSRERISNSSGAPAGAPPEREKSTSLENNHNQTKSYHNGNTILVSKGYGRAGSEASAILSRSDSLGSPQSSQARAQTVHSLRRTSSSASSDAFGSVGGFGGSSGGLGSAAGASVTSSSDPDVLKTEIRRLQAALMNEFKGGSRFVGGAQFKASKSARNGQRHGGVGGKPCGGCLQVRV